MYNEQGRRERGAKDNSSEFHLNRVFITVTISLTICIRAQAYLLTYTRQN